MSKIVLAVGAMASAILLSCTTVVLMAAQGVAQTTTETVTLVGAGDIAECSPDNNAKATAALLANIPGTVLALGDNAYPHGSPKQYANCYDNYKLPDGSVFDANHLLVGTVQDSHDACFRQPRLPLFQNGAALLRLLQREEGRWLQAARGAGAEHTRQPWIDTRQGLLLLRQGILAHSGLKQQLQQGGRMRKDICPGQMASEQLYNATSSAPWPTSITCSIPQAKTSQTLM